MEDSRKSSYAFALVLCEGRTRDWIGLWVNGGSLFPLLILFSLSRFAVAQLLEGAEVLQIRLGMKDN